MLLYPSGTKTHSHTRSAGFVASVCTSARRLLLLHSTLILHSMGPQKNYTRLRLRLRLRLLALPLWMSYVMADPLVFTPPLKPDVVSTFMQGAFVVLPRLPEPIVQVDSRLSLKSMQASVHVTALDFTRNKRGVKQTEVAPSRLQ